MADGNQWTGRGLPFVPSPQQELSCFQVTYELNNQTKAGKGNEREISGGFVSASLCKRMLFNVGVTQLEENYASGTPAIQEFQDAP